MTYSTQQDLSDLIDSIHITSDWTFSAISFYGTGLNDMIFFALQPVTDHGDRVDFVIRISRNMAIDFFDHSINNGASFSATDQGILETGVGLPVSIFGINIDFGAVDGHTIGDYWKFTATPGAQSAIRSIAYDWVNDNLERHHHTVPIPSPSKTVMLAEATYAIYLYLRAANDARSAAFHQEAIRLITLLTTFKTVAKVPEEAGATIRATEEAVTLRSEQRYWARRAELRKKSPYAATRGV